MIGKLLLLSFGIDINTKCSKNNCLQPCKVASFRNKLFFIAEKVVCSVSRLVSTKCTKET